MPTYSYRCPSCGNAFDIHQSFTDDALTVCDRCGGALRKVFSPVGIAFKGSGFYRTDSVASASPKTDGASGGSQDSAPASSPAPASTPAPTPAAPSATGSSTN
ncbi:FmdB family transcriptional regulator [Pseudoclavibacter chungangensis]|uniref:FmdB family transcriptional regulator n=1 Tax=Pseudoclavibacter chungangensis TaxID=587635 RepID=A0A7J5C0H7_9MICO|nr:FmdB family zinc ribbon protein [Pseudoclavibacter chungangensis]KAB1660404.1 FmdB family transcriptional regulator [Pseudoclavibacter chungangensis]NYJ65770.1 putative FmdB family regulatory protein [Pseudoclavibacter chungangensis]